jgi:mono/diheme cytochrome c family protein
MNNATLLLLSLTLVASSAQAALLPGDAAKGKAVYDKTCVACHDTSVYTRANRRIQSVEGLIGQVNGCVRQTGAKLDRDQINDVVKYLDESFYKFK